MTVDYDLVILGGSSVARYAAIEASRLKARVALVEPDSNAIDPIYLHHSLLQAGRLVDQIRQAKPAGIDFAAEATIDFEELRQRALSIAQVQAEWRSSSVLAALGVDVIAGQGEFFRRPHLGVAVNGRSLRSRAYLIATGSRAAVMEGMAAGEAIPASIPGHLAVIGGEPFGIELAQTFARLGSRVTLIAPTRLLPAEDAEAAHLIQACLEAEGICVLTERVSQVKRIAGKQWLQAGEKAIEADEILLAMPRQPQLERLNLEAAGVKWHPAGIAVNAKLQTTNPRVYACGEALGGCSPTLAESEASIALKNALFLPVDRIDYGKLPWTLFTQPQLARVGQTEAQARQTYGDDILILQQFTKTLTQAQLQGELTGFCKLIVRRSGEILGAHLVGTAAGEAIHAVALAVQQKLPVQTIAQLGAIDPSWSKLIQTTAAQWQHSRRPVWQTDLLESWFNWRRSNVR